jgi:hypothetical protein
MLFYEFLETLLYFKFIPSFMMGTLDPHVTNGFPT